MRYDIRILQGAGEIEFGMSVEDVRKRLSGIFTSYVMGGSFEPLKDDHPTDYYEEDGLFCYYDKQGRLEAMEFLTPSQPMLGIVDVLSLPVGQAISLLKQLDPELEVDSEGATSYRLSLAIQSLHASEGDHAPVDSFLVGRPRYYDMD